MLVVEDEFLISMLIEDALADIDCVVVGPCATLAEATAAAASEQLDFAFLDVNLRGEKVYPAAEILAGRGVPFVLLSGYGDGAVPEDRKGWATCPKPFTATDLVAAADRRLAALGKD